MSIDYAHLREWLDTVDQTDHQAGDTIEFSHPGSTVEIVRELLRLHDGGSQLLAKKRAAVERLYSTDQVIAAVLEGMCDELGNLLNGGTE